MKYEKELAREDNPSVYAKLARRRLDCDRCPPHRGENAGRYVKHGAQKPRHKDHGR